jgi:cytochrome c
MPKLRLVALLLAATVPAAAHAQAASGEQLFKQRCQICHAAGKSILAPSLAGVVGRKAGTETFNYSPALKAAKITWTPAALDKYLTAPSKMVPGTRMVVSLPDKVQRSAVIAHLGTLRLAQ